MSRLWVLRGVALLLIGLAVAFPAQAHGPTRQKVVQSIEIAATPAQIWAVVGNFHDMSWHPGIEKTDGSGGNEVNALRTLTLKSGGQITESLDRYDAAQFVYTTFLPQNDPKAFPVSNFSTVLTVTAAEGGKSNVDWRAAAYRGYPNADPPPELNDDAAVAAMTAYLSTGLQGLKQKVEGVAPLIRIVLAVLVLLAGPAGADQRPLEAFVTDQKGDAVSVLDLAAGRIVATIPIEGHPAGIAMSRDGARAYVTSPDGQTLSIIDAPRRRVLRRVGLPGGPLGVAVSPDGATVFVADWYSDRVMQVDTATGRLRRSITVGRSPSGLAVTPDGRLVVVANRLDDTVSLVDPATGTRLAVIGVGGHPFGVTIDPVGRCAYAADVESDDVAVVDLAARRLVARIPTGRRPYVVALAGRRGFVTNELAGSVTAFDLDRLQPVGLVPVGESPEGIEADGDGRTLYVANWMDDTVSVVDAERLVVTATLKAGDSPRAFGTFLRAAER